MKTTTINDLIGKRPNLKPMLNETALDLQLMPLSIDDADKEVISAELNINVTDPVTSVVEPLQNNFICAIAFDAFEGLFKEATDAYKASGSTKPYITALVIYLGIDKSNPTVIFPVFKSAYMELTGSSAASRENRYKSVENAVSYCFDGTKFNSINNANDYCNNYYSYINLFGSSYKPGSDTKAIIFPFQEIFTLEYDNRQVIQNLTEGWFFNSVQNSIEETNGVNKHSILLSPQINLGGILNFTMKNANRTHLCPPYCNGVTNIPYNV